CAKRYWNFKGSHSSRNKSTRIGMEVDSKCRRVWSRDKEIYSKKLVLETIKEAVAAKGFLFPKFPTLDDGDLS
ncbi:hypothetical protein K0M31_010116, partial [Melipona bicolor]